MNKYSLALAAEGEFENDIMTPAKRPMPPSRNIKMANVSFGFECANRKATSIVTEVGMSE